jgi:hypothetical protein
VNTQTEIKILATDLTYAQYATLLAAVNAFKSQHPEITQVAGTFREAD